MRDLTNKDIVEMRAWLIECYPSNEDEIDQACREDIIKHADSEYSGGIEQFLKDGRR